MTQCKRFITMKNITKYKRHGLRFGFLAVFGLSASVATAQFVVHNNGADVTVNQGCIVTVRTGDLDNDAGTIDNAGRITVEGNLVNRDQLTGGGGNTGIFNVAGDWENNAVFTADQSLVNLNGANQSCERNTGQ